MSASREEMMGMTTNERLFEAGLMGSFDKAVTERNFNRIKSILRSVFVDEESIEKIVRQI